MLHNFRWIKWQKQWLKNDSHIFQSLPTRWRRKPAGIDTERNCVTVTLSMYCNFRHTFVPYAIRPRWSQPVRWCRLLVAGSRCFRASWRHWSETAAADGAATCWRPPCCGPVSATGCTSWREGTSLADRPGAARSRCDTPSRTRDETWLYTRKSSHSINARLQHTN